MPAKFIKSVTDTRELPHDARPQVVLVGRSNVGKSSLINHVAGQKDLARVSATPGRTQTINLYDFDGRLYLVDLPGYGYAKASKQKRQAFEGLISDCLYDAENLRLVLVIIDARHGATDLDLEMLDFLETQGLPFAVVANKTDKLSKAQIIALINKLKDENPGAAVIAHSAVDKVGAGEIRELMAKA